MEEVLQSGRDIHTVFLVSRREYVDQLRHGSDGETELSTELLELARRAADAVAEGRRRRKYRGYLP